MISHEGNTEKEHIEVSVPDHKYLEVMGASCWQLTLYVVRGEKYFICPFSKRLGLFAIKKTNHLKIFK